MFRGKCEQLALSYCCNATLDAIFARETKERNKECGHKSKRWKKKNKHRNARCYHRCKQNVGRNAIKQRKKKHTQAQTGWLTSNHDDFDVWQATDESRIPDVSAENDRSITFGKARRMAQCH